ncbi:MAG: aminotransferase class V-fold PLP-dependent enzyme [Clostridia bacterium]|nr:aminotransferase class V-fold PLP-dependent enzyme [Clostridia bacterium]
MSKEQSIREFLHEHAMLDPVSFHMPGHKGSRIYKEYGYGEYLENIMDYDITEIPGADNLFQTEGIINTTMEKYAKLYGVEKSYLLVNGSSSGIISAILATVPLGGKIIMARNSHKSIFNALSLAEITPVYAYPETVEKYGILGSINPAEIEKLFNENPDASAVILPSPNYYGICSDVEAIAKICHDRGKVLIVDQAHGAHLKFFNDYCDGYPTAAENAGADIVICSTHKTLLSWTQTAILNVCSDRVDLRQIEDKLQTVESSSPSYPLMASLDINADILAEHGAELIRAWDENITSFYNRAKKISHIRVLEHPMLDRTKMNIDMSNYGYNGDETEKYLNEQGVFPELVTGNIIMAMSGIGNRDEDYERLLKGLNEIEIEALDRGIDPDTFELKREQPKALTNKLKQTDIPFEKEFVSINDAVGRVCAQSIIPYPPGIPAICPGEIYDEEIVDYIIARRLADEKVIGLQSDGFVCVGKEE